ncbi:MAG: hypothetical protein JST26_13600 [Bacteroidetes bacterium]|nr:hypothetical protein [Bacteroidota bacterium]
MKTLFVFGLACLFTACSYPLADKPSPGVNVFNAGEKFRVNLPEDHSKGFTWVLSNEFDHQAVDYIKAVWHGPEKGVDFNFEAKTPAKTRLTFYSIMYHDTADVKNVEIEIK